MPILTYGAQTWSLTKAQAKSLQVNKRSMERSIIGIRRTDKVMCVKIREMTGTKHVLETVGSLKIRYAGHIARTKKGTWSKRSTEIDIVRE
mgnify:CR=1 FL=1